MPSISSRIVDNPKEIAGAQPPRVIQQAAPPLSASQVSTTLRCPMPNLITPSPDNLRQYYNNGVVPQYRLVPPSPIRNSATGAAGATGATGAQGATGPAMGSGVPGYIPIWSTANYAGDSVIDQGVTTPGVITAGDPVTVNGNINTLGSFEVNGTVVVPNTTNGYHGTGAGDTKIQRSDGTGASGHVASFDATGGLTDGGVLPANTPAVAHEWIDAYNSSTGAFTQTQPAFSDISGTASWAQVPPYPYRAVSAATTLTTADYQIEITSGTFTQPLPTAIGIPGRAFSIKNTGTGTITISTTSSQTIDSSLTQNLAPWDNLQVMSNGANWIII